MRVKTIFLQLIVIWYVFMTNSAFVYTMTRERLAAVPWWLLRYHYGMMAPYQGYPEWGGDLLAEGQKQNGTWETIDLDPYYPMILGNRVLYRRMRNFYADGPEVQKQKYDLLAEQLLQKHSYESIRLTWQQWPVSKEGYYTNRGNDDMEEFFITQIP